MAEKAAGAIRIRLDEAAFRQLVAGDVVTLTGAKGERVKMILADIGWQLMLKAIEDARFPFRKIPNVEER
jgi:hypothetical protein